MPKYQLPLNLLGISKILAYYDKNLQLMLQNSNPFYANCFSILAEVEEFLQIVSGFWLKVRIRQICKGVRSLASLIPNL